MGNTLWKVGDCTAAPITSQSYEHVDNATWLWGAGGVEYPGYSETVDPGDSYKPGVIIYTKYIV